MSCKCNTQTFETIQVLSPPNLIIYCPKCKTTKKKKIDSKKYTDKQKIKIPTIDSDIKKEIASLKENYAKKKDNTKVRENLVNLINEKVYYHI